MVAVPTCYTELQRLSLIEAAGLYLRLATAGARPDKPCAGFAGLSVLRVISEPVAAAISYDLDR